ncbi:deoxyribose-specific ABC transporter [Liquorilactobacillus sucicola DSM 21376 = JCM 15457]|uniref:ABC transporter ATP-binding protein n=1 Tax=Liquorilactobacillus sucicola DSM 21376 = JCM 15457 TaxID=1423806 RepID=A0A023CYQ2_9LACO|nr:ABC transporter ATP-binding protein [Liquorilactobacillus sucicola]KRN06764.1 ABC transporter ATP-binding protein [Liquorilactobacillus sucicola DSM 21376 = JCM 15457]GAJ27038.1 deoxyribose-specific ABC transporter [Liquorilactobacillus sucicola DSM 21376 = JCM 15457]
MEKYVVQMKNITKNFGNYKANDDISLELKQGEILALLGENGAGKSTLMGMLSGLLQPTSGDIIINDKIVRMESPREAKKLGIGMVHQHFMLIPAFSVLENIILGDEPLKAGRINYKQAAADITLLAGKYHLEIDLNAKVRDITVGMQQRVEIMKALYRKANIFIFDEPTAALTPQEIKQLMKVLRTLAAEGKSVIFITHKLKEIKEAADRCVVIRMGKLVDTVEVSETKEESLAEMMVGHKVNFAVKKQETDQGKEIFRIENLNVEAHGQLKLKNLSLTVHAGEIVGVAGVDGNGQSELIAAITGLQKVKKGVIMLGDKQLQQQNARKIAAAGIGCIPEDRQNIGLILPLTIAENLVLKSYYKQPISNKGFLNYKRINEDGRALIEKFDIRSQSEKELVEDLSGGNQQKVIVAREINAHPDLLIAANPTRGVDIGAIEYIHEKIVEQRNSGHGVLLVSFELEEILKLSDRVVVMHEGQIVGEIDPRRTSSEELGLLMAGRKIAE